MTISTSDDKEWMPKLIEISRFVVVPLMLGTSSQSFACKRPGDVDGNLRYGEWTRPGLPAVLRRVREDPVVLSLPKKTEIDASNSSVRAYGARGQRMEESFAQSF